jgi:hypothetical protein
MTAGPRWLVTALQPAALCAQGGVRDDSCGDHQHAGQGVQFGSIRTAQTVLSCYVC